MQIELLLTNIKVSNIIGKKIVYKVMRLRKGQSHEQFSKITQVLNNLLYIINQDEEGEENKDGRP